MKTIWMFLLLITGSLLAAAQEKDLLSGKYDVTKLGQLLTPQAKWEPFPRLQNRAAWAKADQASGKALIAKAEEYMNYEWPGIPATKSLLIARTGNRSEYEAVSFKKREVLGTLLFAEIFENKGRFIDPIVNGVWSVCEESFWGVSAHVPRGPQHMGLVDVSAPFVDLFAAETATFLAWVDYYLGEQLDKVSPQIRKRIYYETNRRIFVPLMTNHHGWMGSKTGGRRPNNWNPWICSNWLNAVLLLEKDNTKRTAAVHKLLGVLDNFLNPYPADGGCDEGPGYWGAAAASLYDNVSMLNLATNNAFDYMYSSPKFRNMGQFIYKAQISEKYFLNFADAVPKPGMSASMIYRYGKDIKDPDMMKFGAYYMQEGVKGSIGRFHFFRNFFSLFMQDEFDRAAKGLPLPADVWWPDLEVMAARDHAGRTDGFFVAAKGGNNDESHNHNDIGNYVVYYNGNPVLIDIGSGTYTARTFSGQRYDIWFNRSDYHNVPTINGRPQQAGAKFKATGVAYKNSKSYSEISMDIAASYPEQAGVRQWKRSVRLNKGKNVEVKDVYKIDNMQGYTQHLMTCFPVEVVQPGTLVVHADRDFYVRYPAAKFTVKVDQVAMDNEEDQGVKRQWGEHIYRISLEAVNPAAAGEVKFTIAPAKP
ncbi:heparinase II/III domain-containing protein [Chitinophaga alhagiae]|uniref:heparinase II/III domain-containing protein n=1 Tax=Chitinophaga alhagiae TaxID=2203219 RepID=UPI000E5A1C17|nr:heparinase II/III family protein [Chitinophaga alhagiae]